MSLEALWTLEFQTNNTWTNGGVVVLESNKIYGGDSQYYYLGNYELNRDTIIAKISGTHYHGPINTIWGTDEKQTQVSFTGTYDKDEGKIVGELTNSQNPDSALKAVLTKRNELP